ncbi:MAG TPA: dihydrofolate reductase family protein [Bacillota bacterium]
MTEATMRQLFPFVREFEDATAIYDELTWPAGQGGRPYVAVNMVSTLDGRATVGGRVKGIGSELDRRLMSKLRSAADAVLRGAGTVRSNPAFPGVVAADVPLRRRKGLTDQPLAVIVSGSLDLPWQRGFAANAPTPPIVLTAAAAPPERLEEARAWARVHVVGDDRVELEQGLTLLAREYGVRRLLCEGGPHLNWQLLAEGLLDEWFWTVAPKFGGGTADLPSVAGPEALPLPEFELVSAYVHQHELFLRYRRVGAP